MVVGRQLTILLALSIMLAACSGGGSEGPEAQDAITWHKSAEEQRMLASRISNLSCDEQEDSVTFTITNTGTAPWSVDAQVPEDDPELTNVRVFMNGMAINTGVEHEHPETGAALFGPQDSFSENCDGGQVLMVGASITCTIEPIGSEEDGNDLWVESGADEDDHIKFNC